MPNPLPSPSCRRLVVFRLCMLAFAAGGAAAGEPAYSVRLEQESGAVSIRLRHDTSITGGTLSFAIDPAGWTIAAVARGKDIAPDAILFSTLFADGTVAEPIPVADPLPLIDAAGDPVPGAALIGWIDATDGSALAPAGDREVLRLFPAPSLDATHPCTLADFIDGLRLREDAPPQQNMVSDAGGATVAAAGIDSLVCLDAQGTGAMLPRPAEVIIDGGTRAVAFSGSLLAPPLGEDVSLDRVVFVNVGPADARTLITRAQLYADEDGDGAFGASDRPIGAPREVSAATQELVFAPAESWPAAGRLDFWLVVELASAPAGASLPLGLRLDPRPPPAWLALLAVPALPFLTRKRRALRPLAAGLLALALVSAASCGGGGGSSGGGGAASAEPKGLQMELSEVQLSGAATGRPVGIDGLPLTGWLF